MSYFLNIPLRYNSILYSFYPVTRLANWPRPFKICDIIFEAGTLNVVEEFPTEWIKQSCDLF